MYNYSGSDISRAYTSLAKIEFIRLNEDKLTDKEKNGFNSINETFRKAVRGNIRKVLCTPELKEKFLLRLNKNDFSIKILDQKLFDTFSLFFKILNDGNSSTREQRSVTLAGKIARFASLFDDSIKNQLMTIANKDLIKDIDEGVHSRFSSKDAKNDGRLFLYYHLNRQIDIPHDIRTFNNEAEIITAFKDRNFVNSLNLFLNYILLMVDISNKLPREILAIIKAMNMMDIRVLEEDLNALGKKIPESVLEKLDLTVDNDIFVIEALIQSVDELKHLKDSSNVISDRQDEPRGSTAPMHDIPVAQVQRAPLFGTPEVQVQEPNRNDTVLSLDALLGPVQITAQPQPIDLETALNIEDNNTTPAQPDRLPSIEELFGDVDDE